MKKQEQEADKEADSQEYGLDFGFSDFQREISKSFDEFADSLELSL